MKNKEVGKRTGVVFLEGDEMKIRGKVTIEKLGVHLEEASISSRYKGVDSTNTTDTPFQSLAEPGEVFIPWPRVVIVQYVSEDSNLESLLRGESLKIQNRSSKLADPSTAVLGRGRFPG